MLRIVKLFELEPSTCKIARQMGLNYRTVYEAVSAIRAAILAHASDAEYLMSGEVELDESYFGGRRKGKRGRGAAGKVPVFGILERDGLVSAQVVPNVKAQTLLALAVDKVKLGSIVYTDKFKIYDSLMFYGYRHLKLDHKVRFSRGRVHINGLEGFWSCAKERLTKYHLPEPSRSATKRWSPNITTATTISSRSLHDASATLCQKVTNHHYIWHYIRTARKSV